MLRVEAEPEPLAVPRLRKKTGELVETGADLRPLPGRVLERDRRRVAAAGGEHFAERARGGGETRRLPGSAVGARMGDQVGDAEPRAALELIDQRLRGAAAQRLVGRREVEQVAVVSKDRANAGRGARRREGPHVVLAERPRCPLA